MSQSRRPAPSRNRPQPRRTPPMSPAADLGPSGPLRRTATPAARTGSRPAATPARGRPVALGVGHPRRRAYWLMVGIGLVFSLFAVQLVRLQSLDATAASAAALDGRLRRVAVPAQRGDIVDASGVVLADSLDRRNVTADPMAMQEYTKRIKKVRTKVGLTAALSDLAPALGLPVSELQALVTTARAKNPKTRFVYLAKDISPTQWRAAQALGVPGLSSEHVVKRSYPQGTSLAPMLGWVNANGQPGGGIEQMLNRDLQGKPGERVYERARDGSPIATGTLHEESAVAGRGVQLTLENDVQWFAQNTLARRVTETGALSGDAVVMSVKDGRILAAASYPSFDNNAMGRAKGYLQSRPFTEVYEPGSTSKVITMAAALEEGVLTPTTGVSVPNRLVRAGRPFKDSHEHGTESLTAAGVLAKSSNVGTVLIGEKMPASLVHSYMTKFGLGERSGIGYPGESRGILAPAAQWKGDQRYTVLFGQGLASTAIQQASVFQTIANGGVRLPVSLIKGVSDGRGGYAPPKDKRSGQRVISAATAQKLTTMMQSVTAEGGTAQKALVPGYQVAGKTSTAERYDPELRRYSGTTASFIGFAPASRPEVVVAVTLQKPARGTYGGVVAAPAFSSIMGFALQRLKIPPEPAKGGLYPLTTTPPATREQP